MVIKAGRVHQTAVVTLISTVLCTTTTCSGFTVHVFVGSRGRTSEKMTRCVLQSAVIALISIALYTTTICKGF